MLSKDQFIFLTAVVACSFFILAFFFVLVMVLNVKQRRKKEIHALNAVIDMQESERKRIAGDLHDQIGPMLSAIKLKINSIRQMADSQEIEITLKETNTYMDTLIQDVRQVVRNLSPTNLSKHGLIQTIEDFKNVIERNNDVRFEFMHEGIDRQIKENAEINIYRIIAELINNSLKHSGCTLIKLLMKMYEKRTIIIYTDNGVSDEAGRKVSIGMGLQNIESRVDSFKGTFFCNETFTDGAFYTITFDNNILTK